MASLVSIDELKEGMIVAEPIINNFGQTLLPAGIKLNTKHQIILKTWNISSVYIQSDEDDIGFDVELSPELKEKSAKYLLDRMTWIPEQKIEKDLFSAGIILNVQNIIAKNKDTDAT